MKKFLLILFILTAILFIPFGLPFLRSEEIKTGDSEPLRAVWIAGVYNIDFPSSNHLSAAEMQKELDAIIDNVSACGCNAIFFQVRPTADAFYQSAIFPTSRWLVPHEGDYLDFDPLAYLIAQSAKKDISVHAWLNPYKVTRGSVQNPAFDLNYMSADNPLRSYSDILVFHSNGEVYMNPGEPQSRALILAAVRELLENYDLAGIHYDDYFYPDGNFEDSTTYAKYGANFSSIEEWRRNNVDSLIKETYDLVKSYDKDILFGVSPSGVWANQSSDALGSATYGGTESYYAHYADSRKWVKEEWLDYIAPQIYWNIGYDPADYETLLNWWVDVTKGTSVRLYPGIALYKLGDDRQSAAWLDVAEITKQISLNRTLAIEGECFYGYGKLKENYLGIAELLRRTYAN